MKVKMNTSKVTVCFILVLASLLILSTVTGFLLLPQWIYFGIVGLIFAWVVVYGINAKISQPLMLALLVICAISIFVNQPPAYFNAWLRLLGFIMMVGAVGPVFTNMKIAAFRLTLFDLIMKICVVLSVGSFFCYFLGINFFVRHDEVLEIRAGSFSGLYCHSMILGPLAGLSSIYMLANYLNKNKGKSWRLVVVFACVGSTLLSASRAALGGCVVGMILMYMSYFRGHISKALMVGLIIVSLLAATFPIWGELTDFVIKKQEANMAGGGVLYSREALFLIRFREIYEHPLAGVGFCCVDPNLVYVDTRTGQIEPGTSWLAVFSMTGVFGFLSFLSLYIMSFRNVLAIPNKPVSSLMVGCLSFYFFHLMFEGYIFAPGSMVGMIFWLLMGNVWSNNYRKHRKRQQII